MRSLGILVDPCLVKFRKSLDCQGCWLNLCSSRAEVSFLRVVLFVVFLCDEECLRLRKWCRSYFDNFGKFCDFYLEENRSFGKR